jgi:hypothetical protein
VRDEVLLPNLTTDKIIVMVILFLTFIEGGGKTI